jgi:SAM-dependent methyltransferase
MAQNIYDHPEFFEEFMHLPSQTKGLNGAPEWPSFRSLLPSCLENAMILDLGCGAGWTCRWAASQGAAKILGIDISYKMLKRARDFPQDTRITYQQADLEVVELARDTFDIALSSLALHYVKDLPRIMQQVFASLVEGGTFVFSIEHPIYTAPSNPDWNKKEDAQPLDDYLHDGARTTNWLHDGVIKYHHTFATLINLLHATGFVLEQVAEWGPSAEEVYTSKELANRRNRPRFLLMKAVKPQIM